jgi:hypothetical protein
MILLILQGASHMTNKINKAFFKGNRTTSQGVGKKQLGQNICVAQEFKQ